MIIPLLNRKNTKPSFLKLLFFVVLLIVGNSCTNPFAPKIDKDLGSQQGLVSDQTNIEGVFQNFKYAYTFKDTLIYSRLLDKDFVFSYRDYDIGADISWGRDEEMKVTYGLFQNVQSLVLTWNNIVAIAGDSTRIVRSFNLSITFNPTNIIYVDGRVNLELKKEDDQRWKIIHWQDESNY